MVSGGDVAEAIFAVHADPEPLAEALLASAPATLVHADAKLENLGFDGDRLVAIDWGELTGVGPPEIDVAWFAVMSGWRLDCMPDEVFAACCCCQLSSYLHTEIMQVC
jgi:aminoglycoside phosphotransferase (APT) family kinase protein